MLPTHLPHPGIRIPPSQRRGVGEVCDEPLDLRMQLTELLPIAMERVQQLTVDVELSLRPGAVADSHGPRTAPALQMREFAFAEVVLSADAVHDLQRVLTAGAPPGRARHE